MGIFDAFRGGGSRRPRTDRPQYPIKKSQRETCERLGLTIEPWMFKFDVDDMIEAALKDPAKRAIENEYQRKVQEEIDRENREEYGDAVVDLYNKWEALSRGDGHCIIVAKRGKSLLVDVVEIGTVEFPDDDKVWVSIEVGLPTITRETRDESSMVLWEKYITIKSTQVLHVEPAPAVEDITQPETYRAVKARAEAIAASLPS